GRVTFAYVSYAHQPDDIGELETLLGCEVRACGSWTGIALDREEWKTPLRRRDPVLRSLLEQHADAESSADTADDLAANVRRALRPRLARGDSTDVAAIARELGVSSRTLQRKLAVSGATYQATLDAVRRDVAQSAMANRSLSIGEIAYLAGYS